MSERKIITVTLNPSLDRTVTTNYLAEGYHNRVSGTTRLDPAGAGVNISRALHQLDTATHAVVVLGRDAVGRAYGALLEQEGLPVTLLRTGGQTRSDTIIHDTGREQETHLVEEGTSLSDADVSAVAAALTDLIAAGDVVVFAGDRPVESPADTFPSLMAAAAAIGAETVVALDSPEIFDVLPANPALVATNQRQLEMLFNYPVRGLADVVHCVGELRARGAGRVFAALPELGQAILTAGDAAWLLELPDLGSGTSSGVWEALLAGYLAGRLAQSPLSEALDLAAAAAVFAADQVGSEFGTADDVEAHLGEADVQKMTTAG